MTGSSRISYREREFVCSATILSMLQSMDVTKTIPKGALLYANYGDKRSVTVSEITAAIDAKNTAKADPVTRNLLFLMNFEFFLCLRYYLILYYRQIYRFC